MEHVRCVYFAQPGKIGMPLRNLGVCKIGLAYWPPARLKELGAQLVFAVVCEEEVAPRLERALHEQFDYTRIINTPCGWMGHRLSGVEWFLIDDRLRWLMGMALNMGFWPWDRKRRPLLVSKELVR